MFTSAGTLFDALTRLKILEEMLEEHGMRVVGKGFSPLESQRKRTRRMQKYALHVAVRVLGKVQVYETLPEGKQSKTLLFGKDRVLCALCISSFDSRSCQVLCYFCIHVKHFVSGSSYIILLMAHP